MLLSILNFSKLKKHIQKISLGLISLSLINNIQINAALVDLEDTERLIEIVLEGASRTMGKYADAKKFSGIGAKILIMIQVKILSA